MLIEKITEAKQKKIHLSPCHTNRASEVGHPCERYLVFRRTRWQEATLHDVGLQYIFDEGQHQERIVLRDLEDAGWKIIEQQRDFHWPELQLSAHLDGKVLIEAADAPPEAAPIEVKSMAPHLWEKTNTLEDMRNAPQPWMQKYPAQITLYDLLANAPRGFLILKNKSTGHLKEIEVPLDYEYGESLLKKCERVNVHVKNGTIPDPIQYDDQICGRCPFLHICLPEMKRDSMDLRTDPELECQLTRRAELAPLAKEYKDLDEEVKTAVKEQDNILIGDWLITGKWIHKMASQKPPKATTYWQTKIQDMRPKKGADDD